MTEKETEGSEMEREPETERDREKKRRTDRGGKRYVDKKKMERESDTAERQTDMVLRI
jgi:hypothetical protein